MPQTPPHIPSRKYSTITNSRKHHLYCKESCNQSPGNHSHDTGKCARAGCRHKAICKTKYCFLHLQDVRENGHPICVRVGCQRTHGLDDMGWCRPCRDALDRRLQDMHLYLGYKAFHAEQTAAAFRYVLHTMFNFVGESQSLS